MYSILRAVHALPAFLRPWESCCIRATKPSLSARLFEFPGSCLLSSYFCRIGEEVGYQARGVGYGQMRHLRHVKWGEDLEGAMLFPSAARYPSPRTCTPPFITPARSIAPVDARPARWRRSIIGPRVLRNCRPISTVRYPPLRCLRPPSLWRCTGIAGVNVIFISIPLVDV